MLTDAIFTHVSIILKKTTSLRPFIFLELSLASITDPSNLPVCIPNGKKVTLLTGKVDYAIISMSQACKKIIHEGTKLIIINILLLK